MWGNLTIYKRLDFFRLYICCFETVGFRHQESDMFLLRNKQNNYTLLSRAMTLFLNDPTDLPVILS